MQISKGGTWAIGAAAVALFAVFISYAPPALKAHTASQVASGEYAVDDWEYLGSDYGPGSQWDYVGSDYGQGSQWDYIGSDYGPGSQWDYVGSSGGYYDEYVDVYEYGDYAPSVGSGWYIGGSVSPFPAVTVPITSGLYPRVQAQPIVVANPNYYNQQLNAAVAYNNRVNYSNYVASQPHLPQPSCSLVANPSTVAAGGSTTLTWGSQYGTSATLDAVGSVSTNGSRTVSNITSTRTYGLAVSGPGGTGACYALVSVRAAGPALTCLISTNPVIIQQGQSASLAWGTTGAVAATLSGPAGSAAVPLSGGITITPSQSTNYTIAIRDSSGNTQSCTTGIVVQ